MLTIPEYSSKSPKRKAPAGKENKSSCGWQRSGEGSSKVKAPAGRLKPIRANECGNISEPSMASPISASKGSSQLYPHEDVVLPKLRELRSANGRPERVKSETERGMPGLTKLRTNIERPKLAQSRSESNARYSIATTPLKSRKLPSFEKLFIDTKAPSEQQSGTSNIGSERCGFMSSKKGPK